MHIFLGDHHHSFLICRSAWCVFSVLSHIQKTCIQELRFTKILVIFTASSGLFSLPTINYKYVDVKTTTICGTFWYHCLDLCKCADNFTTHHCFYTFSSNVNKMKKANYQLTHNNYENSFGIKDPLKVSRIPHGSIEPHFESPWPAILL